MTSEDPMDTQAMDYADKVLMRHVPHALDLEHPICGCCHQRVHGQPLWPCDARKLAILVLQRRQMETLLRWVAMRLDAGQEGPIT